MKNEIRQRYIVRWSASFLSAVLLLSMLAAPVVASVAANTVDSTTIVDRSIKAVDIATGAIKTWKLGDGAVTSAKIRNGSVRSSNIGKTAVKAEHIATGAINAYKIKDGTIKNADIANGAAISASKINTTGLNADKLDGKHAGDFATADHTHDGGAGDTTSTRYLSVSVAAFRPLKDWTTYYYSEDGFLYATPPTTGARFSAPVDLPHGARVTNVRYHFYDNATENTWVYLRRASSGASLAMSYIVSTSAPQSASWQNLDAPSIEQPVIDNTQYSYALDVRVHGSAGDLLKAGHVIITYEVSVP